MALHPSLKNLFIILTVLALTYLLARYEYSKVSSLYTSPAANEELMVESMPNFSFTDMKTGSRLTSQGLTQQGKNVVLVHFWGTWCAPCLPEFPEMVKFSRQFGEKRNVVFLLVAVNDDERKVKKFVKKYGELPSNVIIALDPKGQGMTAFGTVKVPETYVYKDQKSAKRFVGPQEWLKPYYAQEMKKLID